MSKSMDHPFRRHFSQILENMHGGLILIDPQGRIVMVNRALEQMTGQSRDEIVGKPCTVFQCDACEMIRKNSRKHWCKLFEHPEGKRERVRCDIIRKDGAIVPVLKNAVLLKDEEGKLLGAVETMIDLSDLEKRDRKIQELSRQLPSTERFGGMVGQCSAIQRVYDLIEKAAGSQAPVIIYGESGTGKELVAHAIHRLSPRSDEPFIQLNCAALNESLLESELFGHVKGAFTGAYRHRIGRFEAADRGSIFLDEIADMPLHTQTKLLRVLENKKLERVGDHTPIPVEVRIISATNQDLPHMVRQKQFRKDLFFRISVIPIHLPPLRMRMEDLPLLTETFIQDLGKRTGKKIRGISKSALDVFLSYPWPGNVRELKSALEFAFVVADSGPILPDHLPNHLLSCGGSTECRDDPERAVSEEKAALVAALREAKGNRLETARILGVTRATVWNRIRKHHVKVEQVVRVSSENSFQDRRDPVPGYPDISIGDPIPWGLDAESVRGFPDSSRRRRKPK
jgi:two-component system, NtrC family, response regulator HydG